MCPRNREPGNFYPIPSEHKAVGWQNFLDYLPLFLKKPRPTKREITLLHRLTTHGTPLEPFPDENQAESVMRLITRDNPLVQTAEATSDIGGQAYLFALDQLRTNPAFIRTPQQMRFTERRGLYSSEVDFTVFMARRGHYRKYGNRSLNHGPREKIYAPHAKPFTNPDGSTELFIGLTDRLGPLMEELCDRFDQLFQRGEDMDAKLQAVMYFQLWGASVLHPFFDGNGRAFGGKLIVDLQRLGFDVRALPGLGEVDSRLKHNALAGLGPVFLLNLLESEQISLFDQASATTMLNDPRLHKAYMTKLHDSIEKNMRDELSEGAFIQPYAATGADLLKVCLARDGFLDRSIYDDNIDNFKQQVS
ncbi:MAG: hypothetical protein HYV33_04805 [Candidatus Kerfeldbacteria bacterium]|nr:hypothetical protein [Candidatus Kerfeldbacteria bacterium]